MKIQTGVIPSIARSVHIAHIIIYYVLMGPLKNSTLMQQGLEEKSQPNQNQTVFPEVNRVQVLTC